MRVIKLIETKKEFDDLCEYLNSKTLITLDTEFERRYTYFARLSLIQIGVSAEEIYVVDAHKIQDVSAIKKILFNPEIKKVIHSLYQDIEIFYHMFHDVSVNLYDTQSAAEAAGMGRSISYFDLVKHVCNIALNKEMQKCDWMKRPLTEEQIEYAAFDVQFLFKIYDYLEHQLYKYSKIELFKSIMIKHHHVKTYAINYEDAWKKVSYQRKSESFDQKMQIFASFREEWASRENVPRGHFLSDQDLIKICENLPSTIVALDRLNLASRFLKNQKYKEKIVTLCLGYVENN
jgi:ribonuclease D